ncbi:MAG TPA: ATPase domain-containing protein [Thermoanaerobaculia bacterium]|nr:ATPase domain-containing protein [Thermoanaerobaculia bacterium]
MTSTNLHPTAGKELPADTKAGSGVSGLDEVLAGGFPRRRLFLVEGAPGTGKTTLAMQFLREGARQGERVLYVTLSESEEELRASAASHGWSLDGVEFRELAPSEQSLLPDEQYTLFHPSEIELSETTKLILAEAERLQPERVVFDSMAELRLLAGSALRYRRQILVLKHFFAGRSTVLLLDDLAAATDSQHTQTIAHGIVCLEQLVPEYGPHRRRLRVTKLRGVQFSGGNHDFVIGRGGLEVYPRLDAPKQRSAVVRELLSSGITELDELLGGGVERGTSTLLIGAAGTGKSTLATHLVVSAAARGERAACFIFDESLTTLVARSAALGADLRPHLEAGRVSVRQVDPAELSPGGLSHAIRTSVECDGVSVVVIDSLNGYLNAMPGERFLTIQLHQLLSYLADRGVVTLLVAAQEGLVGSQLISPVDASYLADTVILLRYFEARGEVRQAISVLKKRAGPHERTIREIRMHDGRVSLSPPLCEFRGVLTGVPHLES